MKVYRKVAKWTGGVSHIVIQYVISIKSYLELPFVKERTDAVKKYWSSIYNGTKQDDYIFDGKTSCYFDDILDMINLVPRSAERRFVDLCSGNGSFVRWCKRNHVIFSEYVGIDFSIPNTKLSDNERIVNCDIQNYVPNSSEIILMVNSLCYLSDYTLDAVLSNIKDCRDIIVIDPIPGLFWDAQFDGIILHYRKPEDIKKRLESMGFECKYHAVDYLFKIRDRYFLPLKYASLFQKNAKPM